MPTVINTEDVTTVDLEGTGIFDVLLRASTLHLQKEFKENRIRGNDYATVYTQLLSAAMGASIQYALQKRISDLQEAKTQAEIDLIIQQTATEKANTDFSDVVGGSLLDSQNDKILSDKALIDQKTKTELAQTSDSPAVSGVIGKQKALYQEQAEGYVTDRLVKGTKIWADIQSVLKNSDEAYPIATQFNNDAADIVAGKLKTHINSI